MSVQEGKKASLFLPKRMSLKEIERLAQIVWREPNIAEKISQETFKIVAQAALRRVSFFSGKSTNGLIGGLFYLLGVKCSAPRTQKELASFLKTTDATVRVSYQKWLHEFPDLFPQATCKVIDYWKTYPTPITSSSKNREIRKTRA